MDANLIVFLVLSLVAVVSAIGMLVNKNAVYAALFLILNFCLLIVAAVLECLCIIQIVQWFQYR